MTVITLLAEAYEKLTDEQRAVVHCNHRDEWGAELPYFADGATATEIATTCLEQIKAVEDLLQKIAEKDGPPNNYATIIKGVVETAADAEEFWRGYYEEDE